MIDPKHVEAARAYLAADAAARYCAGDMTATDEAGHEAIARLASELSDAAMEF